MLSSKAILDEISINDMLIKVDNTGVPGFRCEESVTSTDFLLGLYNGAAGTDESLSNDPVPECGGCSA